MRINEPVTDIEIPFPEGETIVSRTNRKGVLTYLNSAFITISGFTEAELLNKNHNIVRHPDMPAEAFDDLWKTVKAGQPWVGMVKNRCKNGDFYWVEANVTPVFERGEITGYLSVRRKPTREQIDQASQLYADVRSKKCSLGGNARAWRTKYHTMSLKARLWFQLAVVGSVTAGLGLVAIAGVNQPMGQALIVGATVFALALVGAAGYWMNRHVFQVLNEICEILRELGEGKYGRKIDVTRADEMGRLLKALKSTQIKLGFDIDEAVARARESGRIEEALQKATANIMITDAELRTIYVNEAAVQMFQSAEDEIRRDVPGFRTAELHGTEIGSLYHGAEDHNEYLRQLIDERRTEFKLGALSFEVVANPVLSSTNERLGTVLEWRDRTQEVAIEREVQSIVSAASAGDITQRIGVEGKSDFFESLSHGVNGLLEVIEQVVEDTARVLSAVAGGNLDQTIDRQYEGAFGRLQHDANATVEKLTEIVGQIQQAATSVKIGAGEIAQGNANLSQRTEQQAANLEETASGMEQMTATVKQNADNASQANQLAIAAREAAQGGGSVVENAVGAMDEISRSSKKIADIISVIDEIAFQTNLLALNAAVEAARAGEQGRGFAVVATEVRNLAGRSATAAKEIKALIEDSAEKVADGSRLVTQSGQTLEEIVTSVKKVTDIVGEIAAASQEQSMGIDEINKAIGKMDDMTQQNAALVEQAAAASESLGDQALGLDQLMGFFSIAGSSGSSADEAGERRAAGRPWTAPATAARGSGSATSQLDFSAARTKHLSWKTRLRGFLDGKESLTEEQAVSHRDCDLGKWLYADGINSYGNYSEIHELEKIHADMHGLIKDIVRLKKAGRVDAAEQEFSRVEPLSAEIVGLLNRLEQKVEGGSAGGSKMAAAAGLAAVDADWEEF